MLWRWIMKEMDMNIGDGEKSKYLDSRAKILSQETGLDIYESKKHLVRKWNWDQKYIDNGSQDR